MINWSGSALFIIKNMNLYQQHGASNLSGWKLEVSLASSFFYFYFLQSTDVLDVFVAVLGSNATSNDVNKEIADEFLSVISDVMVGLCQAYDGDGNLFLIQSNLVISNSLISNYRLSRSENLVPVVTWKVWQQVTK